MAYNLTGIPPGATQQNRRYRPPVMDDSYEDVLGSSLSGDDMPMPYAEPSIDTASQRTGPPPIPRGAVPQPTAPPIPQAARASVGDMDRRYARDDNPSPPPTPPQPAQAAPPVDAQRSRISQELGEMPAPPKSNWAQRLATGVLSASKLAPMATDIVHPKYSEDMRAYGAKEADLARREKLAEQAESTAAQTEQRMGSAEWRKAQAGAAGDAADTKEQARIDRERDAQRRSFVNLSKSSKGAPIYQPKDAPPIPGYVALRDPDVPEQLAWVRGGTQPAPKELVEGGYLPGYKLGQPVPLDDLQKGRDAYDKKLTQKPEGAPKLTGTANTYDTLKNAWADYNNPDSPATVRQAAAQIIQKNQPEYKVVKTKDPNTGADIVSLRSSRAPIPGTAAGPVGTPPPTGIAPRKVSSEIGPNPEPKVVGGRNGFMQVQYVPGAPFMLASGPKAAQQQSEIASALEEVLANVEGGMKASQAIDAVGKSRPTPAARYAFSQQLRAYIRENDMFKTLVPVAAATRSMAEAARTILPHVDDIEGLIRDVAAKGKLGPLSGRFNDFLAGKVGAGDPDYALLRSKMGLFTTGMMRAHVGARGGVKLMDHFKNLWDSGKMDANTLIQGIEGARTFLDGYAKMDRIQSPTGKPGGPPNQQPTAPPPTAGKIIVKAGDGTTHPFDSEQQAQAFEQMVKKAGGITSRLLSPSKQ